MKKNDDDSKSEHTEESDIDSPNFKISEKYIDELSLKDVRQAYDYISVYNLESIYFDTEYGAIFGKDGTVQTGKAIGDSQIGFSHGGSNDVYYVKSDSSVTGFHLELRGIKGRFMVHSHGGKGPKRSYFSVQDQTMAHAGKMPVFMSNHKGEFRVYLPSMKLRKSGSKGELLCSNCVPK